MQVALVHLMENNVSSSDEYIKKRNIRQYFEDKNVFHGA